MRQRTIGYRPIATVKHDKRLPESEAYANAALISAAPELLKALETIAAMRTEYCAQYQMIPGGMWHQVTQWDEAPNPYSAGYGPSEDERIATRYVLDLD